MVLYRRNLIPGGTYFFTVTLHNRQSSLLIEQIDLLKAAFRTVKEEHPFIMKAYVILPDHLHVIWQLPQGDSDFSLRWKKIKALFSKNVMSSGYQLRKSKHHEVYLWQRRFWEHAIRDDKDYENHVNYIHYNPIKHGFVDQLKNWPHSSFHYFVKSQLLPESWGDNLVDTSGVHLWGE